MYKKHLINLSCFLLVSVTFSAFQSYAAQDHNMDSDKEEQITKPVKHSQKHVTPSPAPGHWSQDIHDTIANSVYQSATWFDSFFTGIDSQQIEPKATAKIRFGWIPKARDWVEFDSRFRLKVKLPHFKDRMSLILSDEDDMADNQLPLDASSSRPEINEESFAAALRYVVEKKNNSLLDTRVGISGGSIFAKIRQRQLYTYKEIYGYKVEPSIYYYLDDGLGAKLFLEYNYQYDEKSQFRVNYSIRGSESFSGIRWKHGFYQLKQLDATTASVFGLQIEGERNGKNGFFTDKYTLSYRYRFNAFQKWLFFEVEPFLEFPKNENYTTTPGIALRIEGFFNKKQHISH